VVVGVDIFLTADAPADLLVEEPDFLGGDGDRDVFFLGAMIISSSFSWGVTAPHL
jgi:hypothetical protein